MADNNGLMETFEILRGAFLEIGHTPRYLIRKEDLISEIYDERIEERSRQKDRGRCSNCARLPDCDYATVNAPRCYANE